MIHVLEKHVSDKIAAGEVIERPVSVVKELVENSIDAGATSITVELKNGGKTLIRVTDDGSGIAANETETAFLRHATSKIETASDLDSIHSLGFRGEALASISAVTRTTLITRTKADAAGRKVVLHGGIVIENEPIGCPVGTTMMVNDLFYNTPARKQFLKSDAAESGRIIDLLQQIAIAYCNIRFQVIRSGQLVFTTSGNGKLKDTIVSVFNQKEFQELLPVKYEENGVSIIGCISRPSLTRTNRRNQIFFVNGRVVKSRILERGVTEGYARRMFEGRFPVVFLLLESDPSGLDVNIHPSKKEVRFHDDKLILNAVTNAIRTTLSSLDAVVDVNDYFLGKEEQNAFSGSSALNDTAGGAGSASAAGKPGASRGVSSTRPVKVGEEWHEFANQLDLRRILKERREKQVKEREAQKAQKEWKERRDRQIQESMDGAGLRGTTGSHVSPVSPQGELRERGISGRRDPALDFDLQPKAPMPFTFDHLIIKGCIFNTYIMAEDENGFYLIDQHAAHERCFYEKLVGQYLSEEKTRQPIMIPIVIETEPAVSEDEESWMPALDSMGFTMEGFGPNTYKASEIPTFMTLQQAENFLHDFLDHAAGGEGLMKNNVAIDKLITRSCKSAVKAHDRLNEKEMQALLTQLAQCRNPFSCPHGRPTFIRFTRYDLEKFFKRLG